MERESVDTLPPGHINKWDFLQNQFTKSIQIKGEFGNLIAIDESNAWDLNKFPKIINLLTGEIEHKFEEINSGMQNSSIIGRDNLLPIITYSRELRKLAIGSNQQIDILSI